MVYHYAKGFDMAWSQADTSGHGFEKRGQGILFQGTNATLVADYNTFEIFPEKGKTIDLPAPSLPRSPGHHREWLDAIKTRARCSCHFEYGHRLSTVGHLGNIALWTGETIRWDAKAELTNSAAGNKHLARASTGPPGRCRPRDAEDDPDDRAARAARLRRPPRSLDDWTAALSALGHPATVEREGADASWIVVVALRLRGYAMMEGEHVGAINFELSAPDPLDAVRVLEAVVPPLNWELHPDDGETDDVEED